MFYLVGLGLREAKDISVKGLEIVKKADEVYAEFYTSLNEPKEVLESFFGRKIKVLSRNEVEVGFRDILLKAKDKEIVLLVAGDPLSATTHISLLMDAKDLGVEFEVVHGSSIFTAVAETGLQLYKFGYTVSIPFDEKVTSFAERIKFNMKNGLHTLCLLDLDPVSGKFLRAGEALKRLVKLGVLTEGNKVVVLHDLGGRNKVIKYDFVKNLLEFDVGDGLEAIVVPGELHFVEEEALEKLYG